MEGEDRFIHPVIRAHSYVTIPVEQLPTTVQCLLIIGDEMVRFTVLGETLIIKGKLSRGVVLHDHLEGTGNIMISNMTNLSFSYELMEDPHLDEMEIT